MATIRWFNKDGNELGGVSNRAFHRVDVDGETVWGNPVPVFQVGDIVRTLTDTEHPEVWRGALGEVQSVSCHMVGVRFLPELTRDFAESELELVRR